MTHAFDLEFILLVDAAILDRRHCQACPDHHKKTCKRPGVSSKIDAHLFAHPYVRSKGPSLRPDLPSLTQGGKWRSRMAAGHRGAARSVLEGHLPPCDPSGRRDRFYASASRSLYNVREAEKRKREAPQKACTQVPQ